MLDKCSPDILSGSDISPNRKRGRGRIRVPHSGWFADRGGTKEKSVRTSPQKAER